MKSVFCSRILMTSMVAIAFVLIASVSFAGVPSIVHVRAGAGGTPDGSAANPYPNLTDGLANIPTSLVSNDTPNMFTLFDAAVAWAGAVTLPVTGLTAAFVVGDTDLANSSRVDPLLRDRLVANGYTVTVFDDADVGGSLSIAAANGFDLIFISESSGSGNTEGLLGTTTPIVNAETNNLDGFNIHTTGSTTVAGDTIDIVDAAHPTAGGLSGTVQVYANDALIYGSLASGLAPSAAIVATVAGDTSIVTIFAIEAGAALLTGTAPARHVGLFMDGATGFIFNGANSGSELRVAAGTYQESGTLGAPANLSVLGGFSSDFASQDPSANVTIINGPPLPSGGIFDIDGSDNVTIDGFTLQNSTADNQDGDDADPQDDGGAIRFSASLNSVVSNCIIQDCSAFDDGGALQIDGGSNITIQDCEIRRCWSDDDGGAIRQNSGATVLTVVRTLFDNNAVDDDGVFRTDEHFGAGTDFINCVFANHNLPAHPSTPDDGLLVLRGLSSDVLHCTFFNNSTNDKAIVENDTRDGNGQGLTTAVVSNCIFVNNNTSTGGDSLIEAEGVDASITVNNCLFFGNDNSNIDSDGTPVDAVGTDGNISGDPLFVDAAGGDFSLLDGSPAIDAGGLSSVFDDFIGNLRDGNPDIGAFEFGASPPVISLGVKEWLLYD